MLYSQGIESASVLARKLVTTFKVSSESLSRQDHYDFGMRAVKTTVSYAGQFKKKFPNDP